MFISNNEKNLKDCNIFIVTVPTPVTPDKIPDLSFLERACEIVGRQIKKKSIIVFESTVYPGVTEDFCGKILEINSGLKKEEDFFLGYSPERINPGDKIHTVDKIAKVVSANNKKTLNELCYLYSKVTKGKIFRAKSIKVAEASKVIENSQRDINIAFINEIAKISMNMGFSIYDVLEASKTKWNFLPFYPGLVGGHCIGVDPYYLAYKSKKIGVKPDVILSGRKTNDTMSIFLAKKINKMIKVKSKILILGGTFKENVPDTRNSKVFDLISFFKKEEHLVHLCDPHIDEKFIKNNRVYKLKELKEHFYDLLIFAVNHKEFINLYPNGVESLMKKNSKIFDITGSWRKYKHSLTYITL